MVMLKALSPATRTSTDFGLWGTVVASVAKSVLQPNELHDLAIVVYGVVDAWTMSTLLDAALVFVVLILCLLIGPVRPYHCQTVDVSEPEAPGKLPFAPSFTPVLSVHIHP